MENNLFNFKRFVLDIFYKKGFVYKQSSGLIISLKKMFFQLVLLSIILLEESILLEDQLKLFTFIYKLCIARFECKLFESVVPLLARVIGWTIKDSILNYTEME